MTMPQPLTIVVLANQYSRLEEFSSIPLPSAGRSMGPQYIFVTIDEVIKQSSAFQCYFVGQWLSLDCESQEAAEEFHKLAVSRSGFSRGFYESLLPNPVKLIHSREEFVLALQDQWSAFCETS